jgi:hypothetical protein
MWLIRLVESGCGSFPAGRTVKRKTIAVCRFSISESQFLDESCEVFQLKQEVELCLEECVLSDFQSNHPLGFPDSCRSTVR